MDRHYLQAGATPEFFYFKAKKKLIEVLLNKVKTVKKGVLLNVGAGTGDDLSVIKKHGDVVVVDTDKELLALIPEDEVLQKKQNDLCSLDFPDNCFDLVIAFDVLEHIEAHQTAIQQVNRVLKRGGYFVFTVPAFQCLYGAHDRALNHYRRYDKKIIRNLLTDFRCVELGFWMFFLFLPVALQRWLKRSSLKQKVHFMALPKVINRVFYLLLAYESSLIKHGISLPVGTTIYGIFQKT